MSVEEAFSKAMFDDAGVIFDLGSSDDARAIPILRQAVSSQNLFIEMQAALGLAELHDTESVSTIINACENAPKEAASAIARSLVYFDDPAAQRAVDAYVPKNIAQNLREARAHGKTPYR
jgi:HEAT repeat protein